MYNDESMFMIVKRRIESEVLKVLFSHNPRCDILPF